MTKSSISFLRILNAEEFEKNKASYPDSDELLHSLNPIRYCKAEAFRDCITGTIRVPKKSHDRSPQFAFGFYLKPDSLILIDDMGNLSSWMDKHSYCFCELNTPAQFLLQVMELFIEDDVIYLSRIETSIESIEEEISNGVSKNLFSPFTKYRQKLSELNAYYEQLTDIGELFQSYACSQLMHNALSWDRYTHRAERLQNHVQLLKENMLQLRELYQSVQDAHQNKIMGILTIVTTFFLPLTLLTGWYGMNFENMPELKWEYGYPAVILISLIIAIGEYIYFKKKKFF